MPEPLAFFLSPNNTFAVLASPVWMGAITYSTILKKINLHDIVNTVGRTEVRAWNVFIGIKSCILEAI